MASGRVLYKSLRLGVHGITEGILVSGPRQPCNSLHAPGARATVVYPRLHHDRLWQDDRCLLRILAPVGDLGLAEIDAQGGISFYEPAPAAPLTLSYENVRDFDAQGHQLRQPLKLFDGGALGMHDNRRGRGRRMKSRQEEDRGTGRSQDDEQNGGGTHSWTEMR